MHLQRWSIQSPLFYFATCSLSSESSQELWNCEQGTVLSHTGTCSKKYWLFEDLTKWIVLIKSARKRTGDRSTTTILIGINKAKIGDCYPILFSGYIPVYKTGNWQLLEIRQWIASCYVREKHSDTSTFRNHLCLSTYRASSETMTWSPNNNVDFSKRRLFDPSSGASIISSLKVIWLP